MQAGTQGDDKPSLEARGRAVVNAWSEWHGAVTALTCKPRQCPRCLQPSRGSRFQKGSEAKWCLCARSHKERDLCGAAPAKCSGPCSTPCPPCQLGAGSLCSHPSAPFPPVPALCVQAWQASPASNSSAWLQKQPRTALHYLPAPWLLPPVLPSSVKAAGKAAASALQIGFKIIN